MNENINLCEILKGHEGEIFYSPIYGDVCIYPIEENYIKFGPVNNSSIHLQLAFNGHHLSYPNGGERLIFPSKDQRDWNKWAKEQKLKLPKTWNEYIKSLEEDDCYENLGCCTRTSYYDSDSHTNNETPIEKSALALLKIHQLIEVGYGGNITNKEWEDINTEKYEITCTILDSNLDISIDNTGIVGHIVFHTHKQAEEFLSYPENVQLVKDFYMICNPQ